MAYLIYRQGRQRKDESGKHIKISLEEKAERLTEYLLKTCYQKYYFKLSDIARLRIKQAVRDRLATTINKSDFFRILDLPFKEGGVGLNSKTARAITEEIELILILGYGVSHTMQMPKAYEAASPQFDKMQTAKAAADTSALERPSSTSTGKSSENKEKIEEEIEERNKDIKDSRENEEETNKEDHSKAIELTTEGEQPAYQEPAKDKNVNINR
jgi:hypothetical protein